MANQFPSSRVQESNFLRDLMTSLNLVPQRTRTRISILHLITNVLLLQAKGMYHKHRTRLFPNQGIICAILEYSIPYCGEEKHAISFSFYLHCCCCSLFITITIPPQYSSESWNCIGGIKGCP